MPKAKTTTARAKAQVKNYIKIAIGELKARKKSRRRRRQTTTSTRSGFNQRVAEEVQRQVSALPQTGHLRQSAEPGYNLFSKLQELKKKENDAEVAKQRQGIEDLGRQTRTENERLATNLRWEAVGRADAERIDMLTRADRLNDRAVKLGDALKGFSSPLMTSVKPEKPTKSLGTYAKAPLNTPIGPVKEGEEKEADVDPDDVYWKSGGGALFSTPPRRSLLSRIGFSSSKKDKPTEPDSPRRSSDALTQITNAKLSKGQLMEVARRLAIDVPTDYVIQYGPKKGEPTAIKIPKYRELITDANPDLLMLRDAIKFVKTGEATPL